ncbi:MAG: UDP-N-acetylmuramoyl-L-alanyl-D-glutamate--2,6-diaminopimelate ligase [Planctomycetota bacterium]|jgi:UDP-N-acetylmuramoyl-L-alanyl-D-glutamate--2,6-diaminopimelate ligase
MRLGKLLEGAGVRYCVHYRDVEILGIADDSRRVKSGHLFAAVRGADTDGHRFLKDALRRGALAVVVEDASQLSHPWPRHIPVAVVEDSRKAASAIAAEFYGFPSRRVRVAGVTGTNGKTTVTYYIREILKAAGYPCGVIGTIAHDLHHRRMSAKNTTPGPLETHALLREMEGQGVAMAVMEVSSHALDQGRVAHIPFIAGIFTNLTADHLDYHKTRNAYLKSKNRLFANLDRKAFAVLNADDWATAVFAASCRARKLKYGLGKDADLRYQIRSADLSGSVVHLTWRGISLGEVHLPMPGMHNAANAAAAATFALGARLKRHHILEGLGQMTGVPGRLEEVPVGAPFKVFVDYAHTEHALQTVLTSLRRSHDRRILLVFGCGGDRDREKRPRMGQVAGKIADHCWVTSDNPRSEDPDAIIRQIEKGLPLNAWYAVEPNRELAILEAMSFAKPGDVVLVAGKGHENTQTVGNEIRRFDDRIAVQRAWASLNGDDPSPARPLPPYPAIQVA